ncbi:hypothetical protein NFI96_009381, partial [Prochilodus magdalenae]
AMHDADDPWKAILHWRNTPTENTNSSPAQRLMSRRLKSSIPVTNNKATGVMRVTGVTENLRHRKQLAKSFYDRSARDLAELEIGETVRMKPLPGDSSGRWKVGTCLRRVAPRSYLVDVDGSTYRRNRVDLRVAEPSAHRFGEVDEPEVTHLPEHCTVDAPSLTCDASPYGVGAVVSHIMPNGEEKPIAFASCTLNKAESHYAQIERVALGIVFGVRKFHQYLFGRNFTLLTDHRPLTTIFGPHVGIPSLAASRMQRWALLLSAHTYDIKYQKSELHANADGLFRLPLLVTHAEKKQADISYFWQVEDAPVTSALVRRHTRNDPLLSTVMDVVVSGRNPVNSTELKPYLFRRNDLTVQAGCLLWGQRVIIPPSLRKRVLQQLHSGHCGIVRMKELARSYFWWPGLDGQIEETASLCTSCQRVRSVPQLAPLHPWDWPEEPWQRVHIDFAGPFEEKMFLVAVDAYSQWPEVVIMRSTTTEKTIEKLGEIFSRFGFPEQLVSDNGPQFISQEYEKFHEVNGVQHTRSATYDPSTNGLAERFVQSLKHSLKA